VTFLGIDNQSVELKIINYQFPQDTTPDDYDSNWLYIYINVKSKLGYWQTVDPSLLTWDVQEIAKWFSDLSDNKGVEAKSLEFIEPNLSFHLLDNQIDIKKVRIKFDLESRPKSAEGDTLYFVDCLFSNEELKYLSQELINELSKFSRR